LEIPETVRRKALVADAEQWLADLPDLVAGLERDWSISVGRPYRDATEAFVAAATSTADGTPVVLKVLVPRAGDNAADEITVLRLAGGTGCVRLLRHDVARNALLLERLGPSLADLELPIGRRHDILCSVASRVWRPAPDSGLPTGAAKGHWLTEFILTTWEDLGRPCSERTIEHALACGERRIAAHDDERAVLVHGDVHQWNTLQVGPSLTDVTQADLTRADLTRADFTLVDPDGLLAEPEYDLGVVMREDPVELLQGDPHERAHRLAARTGRDATATWEWGVLERVSTGLLLTTIKVETVGRQMLTTAEVIAEGHSRFP
jgi:streptomycin 6-kinase